MKTIKEINNKEIAKRINKESFYNDIIFIDDCERYIKALKERRIIANVVRVSSSGMSRTVKVREIGKATTYGYCLNTFYCFLKVCGFSTNKDGNIVLKGCGMDMIFSMNYEICSIIKHLGVISEKEFKELSQREILRM